MTKYTWLYVESPDYLIEDDEHKLYADGKYTHVCLQCCAYAGGYGINSVDYIDGKIVAYSDHGVVKSLNKAKKKAIEIYEAKQKVP